MGKLFDAWRKEYPDGTRILWKGIQGIKTPDCQSCERLPGKVTGMSFINGKPALNFLLEGEGPMKFMTRLIVYKYRRLIEKQ